MSEPATAPPASTAKGATTTIELTRAQAAIARRTAESRAIVPDFTVRLEAVMDTVLARAHRPSTTAVVVRACGLALREHPELNGAYRDAKLERYDRVNVGVMVDAPGTLVVPTIFDADRKSAAQIASDLQTLAARVRAGEITQPELSGATFTVSNVGMFGVDGLDPVIVPPQAAILGVGRIRDKVLPVDGQPVVRRAMDLTLVCDHRAVYGAAAARFLARVGELLQCGAALRD
ncbi:2-oxo acid dehydrogenase subunit E2 [Paraconexibacter antarcticus]|uniref:2-oxo acid dehydrogenase subunit E2 n=1 Tax=Paraconexibacter antarcticus TaxID=2949664 RepID=A0ABY5DW56_9ACTN|nr:2-oxo acid dehydrogenase subunit E2 [Paraconexibacter antarcticus]UTI64779.1 2-oxo acid dehydrogenase subunit E2 [Paraconexibacter antarcticus]